MSLSIREPSTRTSVSVSLNSMDSLQPSSKVRKAGDDVLRLNRSGLMKKRNMRSGSWYPTLVSQERENQGWAAADCVRSEKKWARQPGVNCTLERWDAACNIGQWVRLNWWSKVSLSTALVGARQT